MLATAQKFVGAGFTDRFLTEDEVKTITTEFFQTWDLSGIRILVIIPDGTRTMPLPLFFKLIFEALNGKAQVLDYLGTHGLLPAHP